MKLASFLLLLVGLSFSVNAKLRLYSRELAMKHVTDSLERIDSLRVVDSTRVADSMMIARYMVADMEVKEEMKQKKKEMEIYKPVSPDSVEHIERFNFDSITAKTIVIDENSQYALQIDSIQHTLDSICNSIHDNDYWFKNMKTFPISEKKRYMIFLMENNYKDSASVLACCNELFKMYNTRLDLLFTIRNSQVDNKKSLITNHIETLRRQMAELSNFIVALSPEVPFMPIRQNVTDQ